MSNTIKGFSVYHNGKKISSVTSMELGIDMETVEPEWVGIEYSFDSNINIATLFRN